MLVTSSCEKCGGSFEHPSWRPVARFCSAPCRNAANRKHAIRQCQTCGTSFAPRSPDARWCSKTCSGSAKQAREDRICRRCGASFQIKQSKVASGRGIYCSRACSHPGPVARECEKCGRGFTAQPSELEKDWGRFCSNECRRTRVDKECSTCGKPIWKVASRAGGSYCSVACRGKARRNRVTMTCARCAVTFERPASTLRRSKTKYCSKECQFAAMRSSETWAEHARGMQRDFLKTKQPTRCELALYALLDELLGPGTWERQYLVFDRWTVDAAVPALRLILQADGDWWHGRDPAIRSHAVVAENRLNDARQVAYATKAGWRTLRLWESDLLRVPKVCRAAIALALEAQRSSLLPTDVE